MLVQTRARMWRWLVAVGLAAVLGCAEESGKAASAEAESVTPSTSVEAQPLGRALDTGRVTFERVDAEGAGPTPSAALAAALDNAIAQVNGRRIISRVGVDQSPSINLDLRSMETLGVRSDATMEHIVSASEGAVRSFSVLSSEQVSILEAEQTLQGGIRGGWIGGPAASLDYHERVEVRHWRVRIEAEVAKWSGPEEDGRPKVVIAQVRVPSQQFDVGGRPMDAQVIADRLRARLSESVQASNRFVLLDRDLHSEIAQELDFIRGGAVRPQEMARIGQQYAADLVLVPEVERFEYERHTTSLRRSDREFVSYSGAAEVTIRLANTATGEVLLAERFTKPFPELEPSTLPRSVDGRSLADDTLREMALDMSRAIVHSVFPIAAIAAMGDTLVLNFGEGSVAVGERYAVLELGDELVDAQTGLRMGRMEDHVGFASVQRVSRDVAYATWEGDVPDLAAFTPGRYELRRNAAAAEASATVVRSEAADQQDSLEHSSTEDAGPPRRGRREPSRREDDSNW